MAAMQSERRETFRALLRGVLQRKGMTQKQLAQSLSKDPSTISFWLSGKQRPDLNEKETLAQLAKLLELPSINELTEMLRGQPDTKPVAPNHLIVAKKRSVNVASVEGIERALSSEGHRVPRREVARQLREPRTPTSDDVRLVIRKLHDERAARGGAEVTAPALQAALRERGFKEVDLAALREHLGEAREPGPVRPPETEIDRLRNRRDEEEIRDRIRFICRQLNREFKGHPERPLTKGELWVRMRAVLGDSGFNITQPMFYALLDFVADLRLARIESRGAGPDDYLFAPLWVLSADYVINKLFGFSTGIRGLDFLFDGGLLPAVGGGLIAILKGNYGRAKSTFALEVAAGLAKEGQVVIYACTEESPLLVLERLSYLGYHTRKKFSQGLLARYESDEGDDRRDFLVATSDFISNEVVGPLIELAQDVASKGGLLLIVALPPPFQAIMNKSDVLANAVRLMKREGGCLDGRFSSLFLDSLDAVSETEQRELLDSFFTDQREHRRHFTFLLRKDSESVKDFLADIVIRLFTRGDEPGMSERCVEIEKCRSQNHRRGLHPFTINQEEGLTVYPSIPSTLNVWANVLAPPHRPEPIKWSLPELDLDSLLQGAFIRGGTALLYGGPGTHKLSLALSFLAAEAEPQAGNSAASSRGAIFSLVEDERSLLNVTGNYERQLASRLLKDGRFERLTFLYPSPGYVFPEKFFNWISNNVSKRQNLSRVVLNGLGTFIAQWPRLRDDSTLIPAILAIFRRAGVTTLILETDNHVEKELNWREIADVVLKSTRNGDDSVSLKVERSLIVRAHPNSARVKPEPDGPESWILRSSTEPA